MAYIRIKRRKGKKGDSLYAVLVESERIDGKPRQRVIKHLATIKEARQEYQGYRFGFWEKIEDGLAGLGYSSDEINDLTVRLAQTIQRPEPAELERWKQERQEWIEKTRGILRTMRSA